MRPSRILFRISLTAGLLAMLYLPALAGERGQRRMLWSDAAGLEAVDTMPATLPPGVRVLRNVPYGGDPAQQRDVYLPAQGAQRAPVILMVHGGGWSRGDKAMRSVVQNKVARWVPRGFVLISTNARRLPGTRPIEQARDVARALAVAQARASGWGADRDRFILMGHSAGAHRVGLIAAEPALAFEQGALPWLGTVALDSAVYDVAASMNNPSHDPIFDQAFGTDPNFWNTVSPITRMRSRIAPFLAICSTVESGSCTRAQSFVDKALGYGSDAVVVQQDLIHGQINDKLGLPSDYTSQVNVFMTSLLNGTLR
jgi:acetyl esterase/lipase